MFFICVFFFKKKTAYEMRISDLEFRRVLFRSFRKYIRKHEKHLPVLFFMGGFIFDTMTLGRIDRVYDLTILCLHMIFLTINIYLFNLADDGKWKNTFIERLEIYLPLAIQFSFVALSSEYVRSEEQTYELQ